MLRCNRITRDDAFLPATYEYDAAVRDRLPRDRSGWKRTELTRDLRLDAIGQTAITRDEYWERVGVMLGLREQIGRYGCWRRRRVGENDELRWSREHVDRDPTRNELFGGGYVTVAWTDDDVGRRNRSRAERERGN